MVLEVVPVTTGSQTLVDAVSRMYEILGVKL